MVTFKKIMCPLDFSDASFEALNIANDLAVHFAAKLYLVHSIGNIPPLAYAASAGPGVVSPTTGVAVDIETYEKELKKGAQQKLDEVKGTNISKDIEVKAILGQGNAADEIERVAKEEDIDLIVISTHGTGGFKHLLFGSVAEKVIRTAACPVLTIRVPDKEKEKEA